MTRAKVRLQVCIRNARSHMNHTIVSTANVASIAVVFFVKTSTEVSNSTEVSILAFCTIVAVSTTMLPSQRGISSFARLHAKSHATRTYFTASAPRFGVTVETLQAGDGKTFPNRGAFKSLFAA